MMTFGGSEGMYMCICRCILPYARYRCVVVSPPLCDFPCLVVDVRWLVLTALCYVSHQALCDRLVSPSWVILTVVPPSWLASFAKQGTSWSLVASRPNTVWLFTSLQ